MQDLRSMGSNGGGGGSRMFGGERRLRPFPNQALKCPRCDSINTKFCYYNNYNLSQPRHFCKSCRRYWTKGGVLRNVPVGGGCRKTKRSSHNNKPNNKSSPSSSSPRKPPSDLIHHHHHQQKEKNSTNNSHSSSDCSSLTATTTTEAASSSSAAVAAVAAAANATHHHLLNFTDSGFVSQTTTTSNPNSVLEPSMIQQLSSLDQGISDNGLIFDHEPGSFTNFITTASNPGYLGFNLSDISPFRLHHHHHHHHHQQQQEEEQQQIDEQLEQVQKMTTNITVDELKMQFDQKNDQLKLQELTKGFYDQTVPVEMPGLPPNRTSSNGELTALDWQNNSNLDHHHQQQQHHQWLFDLPSTVVDQGYWSQTNQWADNDNPLYLP